MEATAQQIAATIGGAPDAREAIAARAYALALKTAAGVLGTREGAADIAQDVAVLTLRRLAQLREPAAFDGWVHRITVRATLREARRRRLHWGRERPTEELPEPKPAADPASDAGLQQALDRALAALPARQRIAVVLKYVHDLTEAEIAAALDCPPGTAASLLSRGRAQLRSNPELLEFARSEGAMR
jgi:RNA polymerase sigma factor (sigma-70 family)